jgi:ribonuclease P protein component
MREALRALSPRVSAGWDLVLIARAPIVRCKMNEVQDVLAQLMRQARVLDPSAG